MKTYTFPVIVEPDGDRWHAYCPDLERYGAATWGHSQAEALHHIQEVVEMVIEELQEDGALIPNPSLGVGVQAGTQVSVTVPSLTHG